MTLASIPQVPAIDSAGRHPCGDAAVGRDGARPARGYSVAVLGLLTHPRSWFERAAARPRLGPAVVAVIATGLASMGLDLAAAVVGGGGSGAVALSLATPAMLAAFWLVSGLLVGTGARMMGSSPRRRDLLALTGLTFPVLVLYSVITLVQAASPRFGGDALSTGVGLAALPLVCWFVVLNAIAVRATYDLPALSAVAITLLPYATLSGVLLLLVVLLSLLHAVGAI